MHVYEYVEVYSTSLLRSNHNNKALGSKVCLNPFWGKKSTIYEGKTSHLLILGVGKVKHLPTIKMLIADSVTKVHVKIS